MNKRDCWNVYVSLVYFFSIHFVINLLAIFAQFENVNRLWNNNYAVNVNEQNRIDHTLYCSF